MRHNPLRRHSFWISQDIVAVPFFAFWHMTQRFQFLVERNFALDAPLSVE